MTANKRTVLVGLLLIAFTAVRAEQQISAENETARAVRNAIQSGNGIKEVLENNTNIVHHLLPYIKDADVSIRENAIVILGQLHDPRAVLPLMGSLRDQDPNVRRRAISALYEIANHSSSAIKKEQFAELVEYGKGNDEYANLAILLIGKVADEAEIPIIKGIYQQATNQISSGGGMAVIGKRKQEACLRVLAKLGDKDARNQVRKLLKSQSPEDRAKGIEIAAYVGRAMVNDLVPLLLDKRDAVDVSPSQEGDYFLRVCDLAADVLRNIYDAELQTQKHTRYSEHDLDMLYKQASNTRN